MSLRAAVPFVLALVAGLVSAVDVQVAAAANLNQALPGVVAAFEEAHPGWSVGVSYAASGTLAEQIRRGAPYDLFLSASPRYVDHVAETHGVVERRVFAVGRLVVYLPRRMGLEPTGLEVLLDPRIRRIVLANPEHAPYGEAAVAALERAGLYGPLEPRLVYASNVAQAAQMVLHGADAGLIARSAAMSPAMTEAGSFWTVPAWMHPPLVQEAALIQNSEAARAFFDFLSSPAAQRILREHGFDAP